MDKKKVEKIASLIVALVAFCLSFVQVTDWAAVGIYADCGLACRMLYPFFHANVLHAALNAWCLLSIVFIYDISLWRLICSYVVAVTVPVTTCHCGSVGYSQLQRSVCRVWCSSSLRQSHLRWSVNCTIRHGCCSTLR